jgi:putative transcriptional regulator
MGPRDKPGDDRYEYAFADVREQMSNRSLKQQRDWSRFDAMTAAQRHTAALSDPDAQPITPKDWQRMKRTPQVQVIRRALKLSQVEFATRFHIPLGTLRDWEQERKEPDAAARAYLHVIARNPTAVAEALKPKARQKAPS